MFAVQVAAEIRNHFSDGEIPEAGKLLRDEGNLLRKIVAQQIRTSSDLRQRLTDCGSHARHAWDAALTAAERATKSIDHWNREMCKVQWICLGLTLLIGVLLGALLYWSVLRPPPPDLRPDSSATHQSEPRAPFPVQQGGKKGK